MAFFSTDSSRTRIHLKDYQPPDFRIPELSLSFDLYEDHARVVNRSRVIRQRPGAETLHLHAENLLVEKLLINGKEFPFEMNADGVHISGLGPEHDTFELEIHNRIEPQNNKALEGLYKSEGIFCTQCEAQGFRRITPFLDRPDNMAVYTTTLRADKSAYPYLLSNGNLIESRDLEDGRHEAIWNDPFPKPSYLFALVAGDLDVAKDSFTTLSGRKVQLQIYVNKGRLHRTAHTMQALKKAMKWDEDRFGLEYDLDLFMIVAVDDFNMGAMENKGLNIFNSRYALADRETATDSTYIDIESIVGHEYFHNWTGNRVTCRDWFQLSLKEGLTVYRDQEFTADIFSRPLQRISDVESLRTHQLPEDAGPNAHPVRPTSYVAIDNFYTATIYQKGAEVIRMIETIVGREGFRKGIDTYFKNNDGTAATVDDFVAAMEEANQVDLSQFKLWYSQAGTPRIMAEGQYDPVNKSYSLRLRQSCAPTPGQKEKKPFHLPIKVGLLNRSGHDLALEIEGADSTQSESESAVLNLVKEEQIFTFKNLKDKPIPSILRDYSAPVILDFPYTDDELYLLMKHDPNIFNRWEAGQRIFLKLILADYQSRVESKAGTPPPAQAFEAFENLLSRSSTDRLVSTKLLSLPDLQYVAQFTKDIDPEQLFLAHNCLASSFARANEKHLLHLYRDNLLSAPYEPTREDMGHRALKNLCLHYLCRLEKAEYFRLAKEQFLQADNMTDQVASLSALNDFDSDERELVFAEFYERWKSDRVVLNTWFKLKATSRRNTVLSDLEELTQDVHFDENNPNNLFSVVRAFASNFPQFHRADGKGYEFVKNWVLRVDGKNPQVAARIAGSFDLWRQIEPGRREKMKAAMSQILEAPTLSPNTFEIVQNALNEST